MPFIRRSERIINILRKMNLLYTGEEFSTNVYTEFNRIGWIAKQKPKIFREDGSVGMIDQLVDPSERFRLILKTTMYTLSGRVMKTVLLYDKDKIIWQHVHLSV